MRVAPNHREVAPTHLGAVEIGGWGRDAKVWIRGVATSSSSSSSRRLRLRLGTYPYEDAVGSVAVAVVVGWRDRSEPGGVPDERSILGLALRLREAFCSAPTLEDHEVHLIVEVAGLKRRYQGNSPATLKEFVASRKSHALGANWKEIGFRCGIGLHHYRATSPTATSPEPPGEIRPGRRGRSQRYSRPGVKGLTAVRAAIDTWRRTCYGPIALPSFDNGDCVLNLECCRDSRVRAHENGAGPSSRAACAAPPREGRACRGGSRQRDACSFLVCLAAVCTTIYPGWGTSYGAASGPRLGNRKGVRNCQGRWRL